MYDVDMSRIDNKLETAFLNEGPASLTPAEVIRLRRHMAAMKDELRKLNIEHLKTLNESVPIDYVRSLVANMKMLDDELKLLKQNLITLEFSSRTGRCPVCFTSAKHSNTCWLGNAVIHTIKEKAKQA